jgi:hypothetical protein
VLEPWLLYLRQCITPEETNVRLLRPA